MKKIIAILLGTLVLASFSGCSFQKTFNTPNSDNTAVNIQSGTSNKEQGNPQTSVTPNTATNTGMESTSNTAMDTEPDDQQDNNPQVDSVTTEMLLEDAILSSISRDAASGKVLTDAQMDDAFINSLVNSSQELTPIDEFRSSYGNRVDVTVITAKSGTATVTVNTPDLYTIIIEAAESLSGTAFTKDDLLATITDRLNSGDYPMVDRTVTIAYTEVNGLPVIQNSEDYVNALYGGILDLYREQIDILNKEAE